MAQQEKIVDFKLRQILPTRKHAENHAVRVKEGSAKLGQETSKCIVQQSGRDKSQPSYKTITTDNACKQVQMAVGNASLRRINGARKVSSKKTELGHQIPNYTMSK